jgi:hypothetical protein
LEPGAADTEADAINNLGLIAGEYQTPANVLPGPAFGGSAGFIRMRNGTLVTFDVPGSHDLVPHGINDLGQVVGLYETSNGLARGSPSMRSSGMRTDPFPVLRRLLDLQKQAPSI